MKPLNLLLTAISFTILLSCRSQPETEVAVAQEASSDKIEAYYFHFTARCVTCRTIEKRAKESLDTLYPEHIRQGLITFQSLNLDDAANRPVAERLGVAGQTLLLVKGDQKINITNEGFMYAVTKPEKFREIINEKVEFLITR